MVSEQQGRAVAFLLNQLRPDWPERSILSLLEKHQDVDLGALIIAATTKAREPTCRTPAPIFAAGPHWPANTAANLPRPAYCPTHTGQPAHNCGSCRADRIAQPPQE